MSERTERNAANAKAFYELMFNACRPREAIERYAGIDIFRFDEACRGGGHRDVLQVITGESRNDNGLF